MAAQHLLAYDIGTGGIRAALYTDAGRLVDGVSSEYAICSPREDCAEQDPETWWAEFCRATKAVVARSRIDLTSISALSFSGQMMACLPVDRLGQPLRTCMIWADRRSLPQAERLKQVIGELEYYRITGNRIYPTYSLPKFMWVKEEQPEIYRRTFKFLQPKDFIVCRLTGRFVTDYSDASGTAAFDFRKGGWAENIIREGGIDREKLPDIHDSAEIVGKVTDPAAEASGLPKGLPVVLGAGDGPCASLGAGAYREGIAYVYLGTSSWLSVTNREPVCDPDMVLFNICSADSAMVNVFGTMQMGGGSFLWLRDTVCLTEKEMAAMMHKSAYEYMTLQAELSPPGSNGLLFLPYLRGERSPRWNPKASGAFVGLTANHTRPDLLRSVLEGVVYNLRVIREALRPGTPGGTIRQLRVVGGGANSSLWRQIIADVFDEAICAPALLEGANTLGAAVIAGVGARIFPDFGILESLNPVGIEQKPTGDVRVRKRYDALFSLFNATYAAMLPLFASLSEAAAGKDSVRR